MANALPEWSPADVALARAKSYTGAAVLVFFLYGLGFIPGLLANWLFVNEAKAMERRAGCSLPGVGPLVFMENCALLLLTAGLGLGVLFLCR